MSASTPTAMATLVGHRRRRFLTDLERPGDVFAHLGPNWFASVMGTGIVANAAALLPIHVPGLLTVALGTWLLAATMLLVVAGATVAHWVRHPENARRHHRDPAMAPFYGAPPMALLTVGAGALLVGKDLLGLNAAVIIDEVLWSLGTAAGLVCATAIPYLMFTVHKPTADGVFGSWLMPVVPPMVSAATGAALIVHLPPGQDRLALLLAGYAMFGASLFASLIMITLLWYRLAVRGLGPARMVPTLWIVLGPLGQSITATGLLAAAAPGVITPPYADAMRVRPVLYGIPTWGFATTWLIIAAAVTLRTARDQLPFSLTWWSFTFPVGTLVTGTSELAVHTQATFLTLAATVLYGLLILAWLTVAVRTARAALRGTLFLSPAALSAT
jgi:C4-dicarboxylate transporter/malic acid transport protein